MDRMMLDAADGSGRFACHVAHPRAAPAGAVVMIQEIFGVNAAMRALSAWVAEMGFIALAPDLFWRQQPDIQLDPDAGTAEWDQALALMNGLDHAKAYEDLETTIAAARGIEGANGKVGTMGFCLGGRLAYGVAAYGSADCNVSYYGVGLESMMKDAPQHPVLLHIAGADKFVPPAAQQAILAGLAGQDLATCHVYPGVDHAFARMGGHSWDARAATIANGRTAEFLVAYLG